MFFCLFLCVLCDFLVIFVVKNSFAKNRMNEGSDIDIVVNLTEQDLFELIGIKQDLEEKLKYPIDIVSYRETMNSFLKKRIDEEAVYV